MPSEETNQANRHVEAVSHQRYRTIAGYIGGIVIAISTLVLLSWIFDIEAGKHILPHFDSMKVNTALCFLACGLILWFASQAMITTAKKAVIALLAVFTLMLPGLTLFEYALGWSIGIDNFLILDKTTPVEKGPGRMSASRSTVRRRSMPLIATSLLSKVLKVR